MSSIEVISSGVEENTPLYNILMTKTLVPGQTPSYEICKDLYLYHPLGKKIIDAPISRAMNKRREIVVLEQPDFVVRRFDEKWDELQADYYIADCYRLSRIYGISSLAIVPENGDTSSPHKPKELWKDKIRFNSLDPLNTAGSMVGILDPNQPDFLKYSSIAVQGKQYSPGRAHIQLYENPVYLSFTSSAFGYVGRSAFNRCLYPMQSYLQSMIADNLVMVKSGVLVAKVDQPGSIIDKIQTAAQSIRLSILKGARTGNTVAIKPTESIESLDLHYLDYQKQRLNILETIALSLDMPAQFLTSDALSQGFGEGTEDAKLITSYIDRVRLDMKNLYDFMDMIVMHSAWNPAYFESIRSQLKDPLISYEEFFNSCRRSFRSRWPDALEPSKKERIEQQRISYESVLQVWNSLSRTTEGNNKGQLMQWVVDNLNEMNDLFPNKLKIDASEVAIRSALGLDQDAGGPNAAGATQATRSEVVQEQKPPKINNKRDK